MQAVVIDLACGNHKRLPTAVGIDTAALPGVDVVADLSTAIPLRSSSVDEILCSHYLEHVDDLRAIMAECHRVLNPGGLLKIWVPHCFSPIAFGDSTHRRFFTFETFRQFDASHPKGYYYSFHFEFLRSRMQLYRNWYKPNPLERLLERLINLGQRNGERLLKCLPYKDWEVYTELRKPCA